MRGTSSEWMGARPKATVHPGRIPALEEIWKYQLLMRIRSAWLAAKLKDALGIRRLMVETSYGQFCVDPASNFGLRLIRDSVYEPDVIEVLELLLTPSSVFMDIGANEGYFSVVAGRIVGPAGLIICVEPQDRVRPILTRNLDTNAVSNAIVVNCAVSDYNGTGSLFISPRTNTGSSALHQSTRYKLPIQTAEVMTLSRLLDMMSLKTVDLMKMDIEGFEYEAILGSPEVFRGRRIRTLILEIHSDHIKKRGLEPSRIDTFLIECGYRGEDLAGVSLYKVRHGE